MDCKAAHRLADEIRRSAGAGAWHGPSVKDALAGVSLSDALWLPAASANSIAALALHIDFWTADVLAVVGGRPYRSNSEAAQWPPVSLSDERSWSALLASIETQNAELAAAVELLSEADLARPMENRDYDLEFLLHGFAQHNAYHAGQIVLLKRLCPSASGEPI